MNEHKELTIKLYQDGSEFCALVGENLMDGVAGFGPNMTDALKDLTNELESEGYSFQDLLAYGEQ